MDEERQRQYLVIDSADSRSGIDKYGERVAAEDAPLLHYGDAKRLAERHGGVVVQAPGGCNNEEPGWSTRTNFDPSRRRNRMKGTP